MPIPGAPAPWFIASALDGNPRWVFESAGGRNCLLLFYGSASHPETAAALQAVLRRRALFDDQRAAFFGVTIDPSDAAERRIAQLLPGIRHFLDYDRAISIAYGASPEGGAPQGEYRPHFLLLDRTLRIVERFPLDAADAALDATAALERAPRQDWAPVIMVPAHLRAEVCEQLIQLYQTHGGEPSGFMRDVEGKTRVVVDTGFKRRRDHARSRTSSSAARLLQRMRARLSPAITRAFAFEPTRIERYIVARYDAGEGGYFRPASRQHHQGHCASPLRGDDQPQRRL
jgi:peroxiredoxin